MKEFGNNIRQFREERGMRQQELASLLHVSRQTVSNYERGETSPGLEMVFRIAAVLQAEPKELFLGRIAEERVQMKSAGKGIRIVFLAAAIVLLLFLSRLAEGLYLSGNGSLLVLYEHWLRPALSVWIGFWGTAAAGFAAWRLPFKSAGHCYAFSALFLFSAIVSFLLYCTIGKMNGWLILLASGAFLRSSIFMIRRSRFFRQK